MATAASSLLAALPLLGGCVIAPPPAGEAPPSIDVQQPPPAYLTRPPAVDRAVTGTASFRERIALPPQALFEAVLLDVSRAGAPAVVLGRDQVQPVDGPQIAFRILYNPAAIDPRASYAVRATIRVDGQLWFTTDTTAPVLTRGYGHQVDLPMHMVRGQAAQPPQPGEVPRLAGTFWRLTSVNGAPAVDSGTGAPPHLVLNADGSARALFGCNRMSGSYMVQGNELRFGPIAATRMLCPPPLDAQEREMQRLLTGPVRWHVMGQHLHLTDGRGGTTAEFHAEPMR